MGYRKISDPVVKVRLCQECRKPIAGFTNLGFTFWLDVTPCTLEVENFFHKVGRRVYLVQPRARRTYWIDWRPPYLGRTPPQRGIVLAEHVHQSPSSTKAPDPPWCMDVMTTLAPPDPEGMLPF